MSKNKGTQPYVLGIIPARGGSKGIPKKNLISLGGFPLIAYSIATTWESKSISRTIVTTDDDEIAEIAKSYGADVPFMRPLELAKDDTPDLPVFQHVLDWLRENEGCVPGIIVHIRPTSPLAFRHMKISGANKKGQWKYISRADEIDRAVSSLISDARADSVRSINVVEDTPYKMWKSRTERLIPFVESDEKDIYNIPRQNLPRVYRQNGYVDVTRYKTVMEKQSMTGQWIRGHIIESDYFVDIDTPLHIEFAEFFLAKIGFSLELNKHDL